MYARAQPAAQRRHTTHGSRMRGAAAKAGWLLGDAANVAGTLLARQLPTQ
jgi:hypothetical protein